MLITSVNNEKIRELSKLQIKKYRDIQNKFLVEGDHLVNEAYKSGYLLEVFVLDENKYDFNNVDKIIVTPEVMKKLSEQETTPDIIGVCTYINNTLSDSNNLLILDGIQDPGNLGTIIRSAVAFNFDILLGSNTVDIYNSKTIRSTEGMIFHINFVKDNIQSFVMYNDKYDYYIADMNKGVNIKNFNNTGKRVAIIMGNEGNGVSDATRNIINNYVHIGESDKCESLNVGVAASIIMYELGDK